MILFLLKLIHYRIVPGGRFPALAHTLIIPYFREFGNRFSEKSAVFYTGFMRILPVFTAKAADSVNESR
jgi:hypothetical protein